MSLHGAIFVTNKVLDMTWQLLVELTGQGSGSDLITSYAADIGDTT
jgi:hypothetical protein